MDVPVSFVKVGLGSKLAAIEFEDVYSNTKQVCIVSTSDYDASSHRAHGSFHAVRHALQPAPSMRILTLTFGRPLQGLGDVHVVHHICFDAVASAFNLQTGQQ